MRKFLITATLAASLAPLTATAGGVPEVDPVVVCGTCGAPSSSSSGLIVPLLLLLVVAAAAAN